MILVLSAALLGGGTRPGFVGDAVVQALAVPILSYAVWMSLSGSLHRLWPFLFVLALWMMVAIWVLALGTAPLGGQLGGEQVAPLPAQLVAELGAVQTYSTAWTVWLSLLPAITVFGTTLAMDMRQRQHLVTTILAICGLSLIVGLLQLSQGPGSPLRFFEYTNNTEAVGFFANRNHFAALLYTAIPLCGVWFIVSLRGATRNWLKTRAFFSFCLAATFLVMIVGGLAMARSRAGMALALAALVGLAVLTFAAQAKKEGIGRSRLIMATILIGLVFALQFGLERMLTRFDVDPLQDLRIPLSKVTWDMALAHWPFGSGLGSFVSRYAASEPTQLAFSGYVNRAHNDFVEILLELGIVAVVLATIFFGWFLYRAALAWSGRFVGGDPDQVLIARAATIIIGLLLAHSLVDYPLRTTALSVIFAASCGFLMPAMRDTRSPIPKGGRRVRQSPEPTDRRHNAARPGGETGTKVTSGAYNPQTPWPDAWSSRPPVRTTDDKPK